MPRSKKAPTAYTLRISLQRSDPLIWRRVVVGGQFTLAQLHHVIQAAMGWTDAHLYEFEIGSLRYRKPHPDDWDPGDVARDARKFRLQQLAVARDRFSYWYDFGDDWMHDIVVEAVATLDEPLTHGVCLAGERACPPEDVGGMPGYGEMLKALASRAGKRRDEFLEWAGRDFDAELFDRRAANAALLRMAWNGWGRR